MAYPNLSLEEEQTLFKKYKEENCLKSVETLILSHLKLVVATALEFKNYNLPIEDLFQEGTIGLMVAVKKFDITKGVRLASYAIYHIKEKIIEFVLKNSHILKTVTTKLHRKLFFNPNREDVNCKDSDRREMSMIRNPNNHVDIADIEVEDKNTPDSCLEEKQYWEDVEDVEKYLDILNDREQIVIKDRFLNNLTFKEITAKLGVSHQRVAEIEKNALIKLRKNYAR